MDTSSLHRITDIEISGHKGEHEWVEIVLTKSNGEKTAVVAHIDDMAESLSCIIKIDRTLKGDNV